MAVALAATTAVAAPSPIRLEVDASDVVHGLQHAHLTIPAKPGPLTLAYPKWVPGEHGPNGPITQLLNLRIAADGKVLAWRRDPLDAFAFHVQVPDGARALDVSFDYASPPKAFGPGFGQSPSSTPHLLVLLFAQLVLYPADARADATPVEARVRAPDGWTADDALLPGPVTAGEIVLPRVSLATLADSPLIAGEHLRSVAVTGGPQPMRMSIVADRAPDLAAGDGLATGLKRLAGETEALFGPGHFRRYAWLVSLSDSLREDGTEHHESSDVRAGRTLFTDPDQTIQWRLFPHELVHSWNGKYRRPAGLDTANFQQPMRDELLWMYEGLTRYYADFVLAARSGLFDARRTRDYLAFVASQMDQDRPGRAWRPLADTATAVPAFGNEPSAWGAQRRGPDYYNEMLLVWLEADMRIRGRGEGRSLDDFARTFFSGPERAPAVRPYDRAEVVEALNSLAPADWDGFLKARIDDIAPHAPLEGLRAAGWTLAYDDTPNPFLQTLERVSGSANLSLSLGFWASADGEVSDVVAGSPAYRAGLAPGMRLQAVDGRPWSAEAARGAILRAEKDPAPIVLTALQGDVMRRIEAGWRGGLRYPHLVRDPSRPDTLGEIMRPRVRSAETPTKDGA